MDFFWKFGQKARKNRPSQTTGRQKGIVTSPVEKSMAKRSRSYAWPGYRAWCKKYDGVSKLRKG